MKTNLYHVTPRYNVDSILANGLLLSHARAREPYKWLWLDIEPSRVLALHIAAHHGVAVDQLAWFLVTYPTEFTVGHPPHALLARDGAQDAPRYRPLQSLAPLTHSLEVTHDGSLLRHYRDIATRL